MIGEAGWVAFALLVGMTLIAIMENIFWNKALAEWKSSLTRSRELFQRNMDMTTAVLNLGTPEALRIAAHNLDEMERLSPPLSPALKGNEHE